jgi:aryl-alcohol dehydrogenase-like predicted oxidoreductase
MQTHQFSGPHAVDVVAFGQRRNVFLKVSPNDGWREIPSEFTLRTMNDGSSSIKDRFRSGMTRRLFLRATVAGGAWLLAGRAGTLFAAGSASDKSSFGIGGDLPVNRLGFGAMRLTGEGVWGWPPNRENALKVLRRAVELGANLIDTADAYGPETDELLIAKALYPYPKGLVIATKGGNTRPSPNQWVPDGRPEYLRQCIDRSLKRLKLERIDLYQLHRVDPKVPMEDSLGALNEAQSAGKIRHIGLSEVSPEQVERARKIVPIVTVQNRYNITDRKWDNTLAYCEKEQIGFMPWAPVGGDRGMSSTVLEKIAKDHGISIYQLGLAWLLHRSPVMLPIPGTSSLAHLEENMAARKVQLSPEEWKAIDALASQT